MGDRVAILEAQLESLTARVQRLEALLEVPEAVDSERLPESSSEAPAPATGGVGISVLATLAGRTCLILGGAYLLRALSTTGGISPAVGIRLGFSYAILWHVLADRAARGGKELSAGFYGFVASAIACPLLWEATAKHGHLNPYVTLTLLTLFGAAGLAVAWHRRLPIYAAITVSAVATVAFALMIGTDRPLAFGALLVGLATVTLLHPAAAERPVSAWLVALPVDAALLTLGFWAGHTSYAHRGVDPLWATLLLCVAVVVYLAVFARRSTRQGLGLFELAQTPLLLLCVLEAAFFASTRAGAAGPTLAALALAAGIGAVAYYARLSRRGEQARTTRIWWGVLGLFLIVEGMRRLLPADVTAATLAGLGAAAALATGPRAWPLLRVHAAAFTTLAVWWSGLLSIAASALYGSAVEPWPELGWAAATACVGAVASYALVRLPQESGQQQWPVIGGTLALMAVVGIGGAAVALLSNPIAGAPGADALPERLAALRTAILSLGAVGLAWAARRRRLPELKWLSIALLGMTGIKMLVEDLPLGHAAALVVSLSFYGGALTAIPLLLRADPQPGPENDMESTHD